MARRTYLRSARRGTSEVLLLKDREKGIGVEIRTMSAVPTREFLFDKEAHVYTLGTQRLPSVTEILRGAGVVDDQWWTEAGRWRGSAVHAACWYDDQNDLDEAALDPRLLGYVNAYRKFRSETGFTPTSIEQPLFNDLLSYAGTPDRIGNLGDGRLCLPDLKSGAQSKVTRFQTAGYAGCLPSPRKYVRMEVRLKENEKYSLQVYEPKDFDRDFADFQALIRVFHIRRELGL